MGKGLEVDVLPVGSGGKSGDCIAIRFGNLSAGRDQQRVIIVDGGYADTATDLKLHLKKYYNCEWGGKIHIDGVFLTHPDLDHVSGLVSLLEDDEIQVGCIVASLPWRTINPKWFKDERITPNSLGKRLEDAFTKLKELHELAEKKGIEWMYPEDYYGKSLSCGDAEFLVLSPEKGFYNTCIANCPNTPKPADYVRQMGIQVQTVSRKSEEKYVEGEIEWNKDETTSPINESSLVFALKYDRFCGLFCGDAGKEALQCVIKFANNNAIDLKEVNFIKMPHHGSRKNITPEIMDEIGMKDCACFISCVNGDEGHHPSKRLVNMLLEKSFRVYSSSGTKIKHGVGDVPARVGWNTIKSKDPYEKMEKL